ncbi:MAG: DUF86 domain-containing protein [Treponema sp.]|jgi:uncharacterized protein with HEPN domain|nr:DUF86 domain-containing protein [Treponema sp.]
MNNSDIQRIRHIKSYCEDIADAIKRFGDAYDVFEENIHYANSVSMSMMQIGELSAGLSDPFKDQTRNQILWTPMKAMRNMFAHAYASMNKAVIWETATKDIPVLLRFCENILEKDASLAAAEKTLAEKAPPIGLAPRR